MEVSNEPNPVEPGLISAKLYPWRQYITLGIVQHQFLWFEAQYSVPRTASKS